MSTLEKSRAAFAVAPLAPASPASMGVDERALERLYGRIEWQIAQGWYPGAAVAMARHGKLVAARTFGLARLASAGAPAKPADERTLWLLFSQTKPAVSCAIWRLIEEGRLHFQDAVADILPEFARNGKGKVTVYQVLSHQGGFPSATVPPEAWADHALVRESVCNFTLEWEPGARVAYHGTAAHWVQAMLIEALTGQDYRLHLREALLDPLALQGIHIGVPDAEHERLSFTYKRTESGAHEPAADRNEPNFWRAGTPGGGGYATASDLCAFYQMLLAGGVLNGTRIVSRRMVQYVTRNHTAERVDEAMGMPMHRGLGVHVRGETATIRGLGSVAAPQTFGHGGAGTSYSWADPTSGVSFTYLTNSQLSEPLHSRRLDQIANMAHAAIDQTGTG